MATRNVTISPSGEDGTVSIKPTITV